MPRTSPSSLSYVLPIRSDVSQADGELTTYLRWLSPRAEVLVVDGSAPEVFAAHARAWGDIVRHMPPATDLATPMGKVGGVLTGLRHASNERVIIADDDVRYEADVLARVAAALDGAEVVRPQNYFHPLPWHARWDTGRTLLNRLHGGDWPGTLGVRRSALQRTGGYDGRAMFENLELVRTVTAAGGREIVLLDALVERRPSSSRHFWSQRIRQAYDELARPTRLAWQLAIIPAGALIVVGLGWLGLAAAAGAVAGAAEIGRRRAGGTRVFPRSASLAAPAWLAERAVCSWLAVGSLVAFGGVPYRGTLLRHAATPMRVLKRRHAMPASPLAPSPESPGRSA